MPMRCASCDGRKKRTQIVPTEALGFVMKHSCRPVSKPRRMSTIEGPTGNVSATNTNMRLRENLANPQSTKQP